MQLFERVRIAISKMGTSQSEMAKTLGMPQRTFQGYLNEKRQDNLWPLLPRILELYPRLSRQWLYFEEGPMFIGQDVPLDQPVPLQTIQQAVELMARDAAGTNKTLLQLVAGQAGEQDTAVTSAKLGAKYAAVLLEGDSNRVLVMESGGREVYTVDAGQLTVVDYGFYSSGSLLWVMALDTTGSTPTCAIYTYKPRSMSIIGNISDTEQLMYAVTFQTDRICTAGVTYYKVYDYNAREIESQRKLVYGWYLISADEGDDPLQAFVPTGQSDGTDNLRDVRMLRNGVDRTVHMPYACRSIVARGDWVYGFSPEGYVMQASPARQKVDAYKMDFYIDRVYGVTESGVAVVSSGSTIYLITLGE